MFTVGIFWRDQVLIFLEHACKLPIDPINGHADCLEKPDAVYCTIACDEGYAFAVRPPQQYFCSYDGLWLPEDLELKWPDCSSKLQKETMYAPQ